MKSRSPCWVTVRDLEDLAARDLLLERPDAVALAAEDDAGGLGFATGGECRLGEGGELIGIVERRHQRAAHQEDRGDAGEDGAGQPAQADRAADRRRSSALVANRSAAARCRGQ